MVRQKLNSILLLTLFLVSCSHDTESSVSEVSVTNISTWGILVYSEKEEIQDAIFQQKFDEVIPKLETLYSQNPESSEILWDYLTALLQKGSFFYQEQEYAQQAITLLNQYIDKGFQMNSELYRIQWYAYEIQEKYEDSLEAYKKSIELDSTNYVAYSQMWHAYRLLGDMSQAEQNFLKALEISPNYYHALVNMSYVYITKVDYEKAEEVLNIALLNTEDVRSQSDIYNTLGWLYYVKKLYFKSLDFYKKANEKDVNYDLPYLWLGRLYFILALKNVKEKEKLSEYMDLSFNSLTKAIELNPNKTNGYELLGDIYAWQKNTQLALFMYQKALEVLPLDITLGRLEKENNKIILEKKITNLSIK